MSGLGESVAANWDFLVKHGGVTPALQVLKIQEEAGEVAEAFIGCLGANPRKGVTHTPEDLHGELADVIVTSLVAAHATGADVDELMVAAEAKARGWLARAQAKVSVTS